MCVFCSICPSLMEAYKWMLLSCKHCGMCSLPAPAAVWQWVSLFLILKNDHNIYSQRCYLYCCNYKAVLLLIIKNITLSKCKALFILFILPCLFLGYLRGGHVMRLFHGHDESLTIPGTDQPAEQQRCNPPHKLLGFKI